MRQLIGNGWFVWHCTDRTLELRKESADYRRLTGQDGFVLVRGEPGTPQAVLLQAASEQAERLDDELARRIAAEQIPSVAALRRYGQQLRQMAKVFSTGEEAGYIGRKAVR